MKRKTAVFSVIILSLQIMMSAVVSVSAILDTAPPIKANVPSIVTSEIGENLTPEGNLDDKSVVSNWKNTPQSVPKNWREDENGGYMESGVFPNGHTGMHFTPNASLPAGKYKLTYYVRTVYKEHKTKMAVMVATTDGKLVYFDDGTSPAKWFIVGVTDEWFKAEYYFEAKAPIDYIRFRGSPGSSDYIVPFCIDEISLVTVDEIPSDAKYTQGATVTAEEVANSRKTLDYISEYDESEMWDGEEDYKIDGLMLNIDASSHRIGVITDDEYVYDWVNQFRGTHITDIVMNIAATKSAYPSDVYFGWMGDGRTEYTDGEIVTMPPTSNDWNQHYTDRGLDYLKSLSKALPEIGINLWLSVRMNDAHERNVESSSLFTEYFLGHPEYYRVQYPTMLNTYYAKVWDFSYPEIRNIMLAYLNESLDRYDVYGYQFEWQREIWNFHPGGEYAGIEIMNQFYRDADEIISIYEEKYGHKIKFAAAVAPDLQTNYDFGLDVMTWVSEGIVDVVVPMGRWATAHNELPVAMWKSILEPYGVELAPCMEHGLKSHPSQTSHLMPTLEMYNGTCALYFSQGADKVQLYNLLLPFSHKFKEGHKIAIYDSDIIIPETPSGGNSEAGWWVIFTSCGSYEKLMTLKRKVVPTYNDVAQSWKSVNDTAQLTQIINHGTGVIRVGMGDIPDGSRVTLSIGANPVSADNIPIVYVNSEKCRFIEVDESPDYTRTTNDVWVFEVPEATHDDMFAVVEITPSIRPGFTIDYAEIYIEPATK